MLSVTAMQESKRGSRLLAKPMHFSLRKQRPCKQPSLGRVWGHASLKILPKNSCSVASFSGFGHYIYHPFSLQTR